MSKYWGVTCKTCGEFIRLGDQGEADSGIYLPSNDLLPIPCGCGSSYVYHSEDVVDEEGVPLNNWAD
jgi:hypothetical protein